MSAEDVLFRTCGHDCRVGRAEGRRGTMKGSVTTHRLISVVRPFMFDMAEKVQGTAGRWVWIGRSGRGR
jgi:hypothetical protein